MSSCLSKRCRWWWNCKIVEDSLHNFSSPFNNQNPPQPKKKQHQSKQEAKAVLQELFFWHALIQAPSNTTSDSTSFVSSCRNTSKASDHEDRAQRPWCLSLGVRPFIVQRYRKDPQNRMTNFLEGKPKKHPKANPAAYKLRSKRSDVYISVKVCFFFQVQPWASRKPNQDSGREASKTFCISHHRSSKVHTNQANQANQSHLSEASVGSGRWFLQPYAVGAFSVLWLVCRVSSRTLFEGLNHSQLRMQEK